MPDSAPAPTADPAPSLKRLKIIGIVIFLVMLAADLGTKAYMQDLLGLLQRQVCSVARNAYRNYVGRSLDVGVMAWELERVPGVDVQRRPRNWLREPAGSGELDVNLQNFRHSLGGE